MFCSACGKELPNGARFCPECGSQVSTAEEKDVKVEPVADETDPVTVENEDEVTAAIEDTPSEEAVESEPVADEPEAQEASESGIDYEISPEASAEEPIFEAPKKKKRRALKIAIIALISVLVAALVWVGAYFGISYVLKNIEPPVAFASEAYVSNGTAYVLFSNGDCKTIDDEVSAAILTPNEKYIVVLYEDNSLYYVSAKNLKERTKICGSSDKIIGLRADLVSNEMLVYSRDSSYYRYRFGDDESTIVCSASTQGFGVTAAPSEKNPQYFNVVYASTGNIYMLGREDTKPQKITTYTKKFNIVNLVVSSDAKTIMWTETNPDTMMTSAYIWQDGDKSLLGSLDEANYMPWFGLYAGEDSTGGAVVTAFGDNTLFIKQPDKKAKKVVLPDDISHSGLFTTDGISMIECEKTELQYGLFVICDVSSYKYGNSRTLYLVDQDGNFKELKRGCKAIYFRAGKVLYVDSNGVLYCAEFSAKKSELVNEERVDAGLSTFIGEESSNYFYYAKGDSEKTLYVYDVESGDKETVDKDILAFANAIDVSGDYFYYFTDTEEMGDSYYTIGTLWVYDSELGKKTKIAEKVVIDSFLNVESLETVVNADSFYFEVYVDMTDEDYEYKADIYHFDGEKAHRTIKNLTCVWEPFEY